MNDRIKCLKERRIDYGVSQGDFAEKVGINRVNLSKIENGKKNAGRELLDRMEILLEQYNPEKKMEILFDYVRIRFPTDDETHIIETVMGIKMGYFLEEGHAFYGYSSQYFLGDIVLMVSEDKEKGILLELKGRGCRQFEAYLKVQGRTWFDFFRAIEGEKAVLKRIDIAINDRAGILDIEQLAEKCRNNECVSLFRSFKNYQSGELIQAREEDADTMGNTLYLGSLRSEIYFCIYEKDYEQYVKNGIPILEAETKNRFEIRLKDSRAEKAMEDILKFENVTSTAFAIINHYVRFVDQDEVKERRNWELNERWSWFLGEEDGDLRLTMKPEPYTLDRAMRWLCRQVAPTLKMVKELDKLRQTETVEEMIQNAKLSVQHQKILKQQMSTVEDMITEKQAMV